MNRFTIRKVAVLGAGVMGAQIAAHLVNVHVPVMLFDLPAKEGPKNDIVDKAILGLQKIKPAPLARPELASLIQAANYDEHLALLSECDLMIEAIAERIDWKLDLYRRIAPHLAPHAIAASNTSGLSIIELAAVLPESLRHRFCGVHFFNPPRYMSLVELIPTPSTDSEVLDQLEAFVTTSLGKSMVRAKDTPNFIANRVGIAGMLSAIHQAEKFGLSHDVVDDLTGKKLGRASSATFRTADIVGLDTMLHVIKTLQDKLGPDQANDPFYSIYATPAIMTQLIQAGARGQKSGAGYYKKVGPDILQFDAASGAYIAGGGKADDIIGRILKKPAPERLKLLHESSHPQAQFLWALLRDGFHYCAVHLAEVAVCARDIDLAMRWGFGNAQGPFELWQEAGWLEVAQWVQNDINAGKALCMAPLPDWVFQAPVAGRGVHTPEGSWSASGRCYVPKNSLPVYRRQIFPETVFGSGATPALKAGTEVFKNDEIRVWSEDGEVLIASITAKLHLISPQVTDSLIRAIDLAEKAYKGLVLWSPDDVFSAGANLEALMPVFMRSGVAGVEPEEKKLQELMLKIRYAGVPVVAAVRGLALGGGCELALHCAKRVAAMESYIGFVEIGVGLLPGAGGLTFLARRAAEQAPAVSDILTVLKNFLSQVATATVSTSAIDSQRLGYLQDADIIVPHKDELLFVATLQAKTLFDSGYRPPLNRPFPVAGRSALATLQAQLVNMRDGQQISDHDFHIASLIAEVLCGGNVDPGSMVTESYLMALERRHFCALLSHPKTQERIMTMLQTGKPVRH